MEKIPRVGLGIIIRKDQQILLGKRIGGHAPGTWQPPGGYLEWFETIENGARREVREETGLEIANVDIRSVAENFFEKEQKHFVSILINADWVSGEPELLEPDKCTTWKWFSWNDLPEPLFSPLQSHIDQGYSPFG